MEETTDESADRRRFQRIVGILGQHGGEMPVELAIQLRGGRTETLRLPGIADAEPLIAQIQPLLGVLGHIRLVGDPAYAAQYSVAAAG